MYGSKVTENYTLYYEDVEGRRRHLFPDGIILDDYIVLEFNGTLWHADKRIYSEDDTAEDEFSIIDALYYLKHGVPQKSKCEVKDDLTRDEVDMLFRDDEVPQKFKK